MVRRAQELLDRCNALYDDFEKLMPKQYLKPTSDPIGERWREANEATYQATDALLFLVCFLEFKAKEAQKRSKGSATSKKLT
jgi:hypothetical protein